MVGSATVVTSGTTGAVVTPGTGGPVVAALKQFNHSGLMQWVLLITYSANLDKFSNTHQAVYAMYSYGDVVSVLGIYCSIENLSKH